MSLSKNNDDAALTASQPDIAAFKAALPGLLADNHAGEFAVLNNSTVLHVSATYEQALDWAYERYGLEEQFLVMEIREAPVCLEHSVGASARASMCATFHRLPDRLSAQCSGQ